MRYLRFVADVRYVVDLSFASWRQSALWVSGSYHPWRAVDVARARSRRKSHADLVVVVFGEEGEGADLRQVVTHAYRNGKRVKL